jgi:hypothetical protein
MRMKTEAPRPGTKSGQIPGGHADSRGDQVPKKAKEQRKK